MFRMFEMKEKHDLEPNYTRRDVRKFPGLTSKNVNNFE